MNTTPTLTAKSKVAFIQASWHEDILIQGKNGFLDKFEKLGYSGKQVDFFQLPGAFEIPLKCKILSETENYHLIIASGFIVDGGIYRHEFVAEAVINGLMNVQLETNIPILSMVLTPQNYDDKGADKQFFLEHFKIKGHEIADAAHVLLSSKTVRNGAKSCEQT